MEKEKKEDVKVPRLDELDALAEELNEEYGVFIHMGKYYYEFSEPEVYFIVSLTGDNKMGEGIKNTVEECLGVKLKAKKETLQEGMIEFRYEVPGRFKVRLDKAMTCEKIGTEEKEVEYKVEISPGKEPVMRTEKKMVEVAKYKCPEGGEFLGDVK